MKLFLLFLVSAIILSLEKVTPKVKVYGTLSNLPHSIVLKVPNEKGPDSEYLIYFKYLLSLVLRIIYYRQTLCKSRESHDTLRQSLMLMYSPIGIGNAF